MPGRPDSQPAAAQDFSFLNQVGGTAENDRQSVEPPQVVEVAGAPAVPSVAVRNLQQQQPVVTSTPASEAATVHSDSAAPSRLQKLLPGYALAVTLLLILLALTGRIALFPGSHALESLPDVRPLQPGEFQIVPPGAPLPPQHGLRLNESRRFGDVVLTPLKVTKEPITFEHFQTHAAEPRMTTAPVLKLWLRFENVARDYAFAPYDTMLMSHRHPEFSTEESTQANTWLRDNQAAESQRLLNFLHPVGSNFVLSGQNAATPVPPGQSLEVFVASAELPETELQQTAWSWRVQFRKGVHTATGHGVTTLVDVLFDTSEIQSLTAVPTAATVAQ
jgi:hypothetical protein